MEEVTADPPEVTNLNPDTVKLAFEEATGLQDFLSRWSDAIDTKIVAVFTVSSVITSVTPALAGLRLEATASGVAWVIASVAWGITALFCFAAFRVRTFKVSPDPEVIRENAWMSMNAPWYQFYRLRDMGKAYRISREECIDKAWYLAAAMLTSTVEVASIVIALLAKQA